MQHQNAALLLLPILMAIALAMAPQAEPESLPSTEKPTESHGLPHQAWLTPECKNGTDEQVKACLEKYGPPGPVGYAGERFTPNATGPVGPIGLQGIPGVPGPVGVLKPQDVCDAKNPQCFKNETNATALDLYADVPEDIPPRKPFEIAYLLSIHTDFPDLHAVNSNEIAEDSLFALQLVSFDATPRGYMLPNWESLRHLGVTQVEEKYSKLKAFDLVQLASHMILAIQETNRRIDVLAQKQATPKTTVV